tara:strand:+ start:534 stop:1718 length:1185 start_codon:yes stop_codon:yes gene_type:complete
MRKTITLLDLFSGIGGFHLGLQRAGFKVKSYNSEIDKYANQVYKHKFKNSTHVGSVTDVQGSELPRINAITFGSPCQDFSLAGKRKGMGGERSSLILEAIRLIKECRPDFFIWENVKGMFSSNNRQDFAAILQAFANIGGYRIEWQLLNTKWFLPQNRERVYLVGYAPGKSRGQVFPIGESFRRNVVEKESSSCITTSYHKGVNFDNQLIKTNNSKGFETITEGDSLNYSNPNSKTRRGRVGKGVAQTLDTACEQGVIAAQRGRSYRGQPQQLEYRLDGNTNTLSTVQKDNYVVKAGTLRTHKDGKGFREIKGGDAPCILARAREDGSGQPIIGINNSIRRLTPLECERLQGFPDNWTQEGINGPISDTQRYKMCGNAVTVDVVEAVGKQILKL